MFTAIKPQTVNVEGRYYSLKSSSMQKLMFNSLVTELITIDSFRKRSAVEKVVCCVLFFQNWLSLFQITVEQKLPLL